MREPRKTKVDLNYVLNTTARNKDHVAWMRMVVDDTKKQERLEKQLCQVCGYSGRIGGAMCTTAACSFCDKEMVYGNTCVDVVCKECAKEHRLCMHCGGDMEWKYRRKLDIGKKEVVT